MVTNTDVPDWEAGAPDGYTGLIALRKNKKYTKDLKSKYLDGRAGSNFMYKNLNNYA
jgi:hypothetical protein